MQVRTARVGSRRGTLGLVVLAALLATAPGAAAGQYWRPVPTTGKPPVARSLGLTTATGEQFGVAPSSQGTSAGARGESAVRTAPSPANSAERAPSGVSLAASGSGEEVVASAPPAKADAEPSDSPGPSFRRFGGEITVSPAFPGGATTGARGDELSGAFGTVWLVGAGAGVRLSPRWYVGGFGSLGWGEVGDALQSDCAQWNVGCKSRVLDGGVEARYRVTPGRMHSWVAFGGGWERATVLVSGRSYSANGPMVRTRVGLEYRFVGFFAGLSVGRYVYQTAPERLDGSSRIEDPAIHFWPNVGLRLAF